MINATEKKAVRVRVPQAVGQLGRVLGVITEGRINVEAFNSVTVNDEAYLTFVTDNNGKAFDLWQKAGFWAEEFDVVGLELPHRTGELATVANRLGQAGIDIRFAFASSSRGDNSVVFLTTSNNQEALRKLRS